MLILGLLLETVGGVVVVSVVVNGNSLNDKRDK